MRCAVVAVVSLAACGAVDEGVVEQQAERSSAFSISVGPDVVDASPLRPRTVTITGFPRVPVVVTLDRVTAGALDTSTLTLDASGKGSLTYTPCAGVVSGCAGTATLSLAVGVNPKAKVATASFTLASPAEVGEVAPCITNTNAMYLHGNDFIVNGTVQSSPTDPWLTEPAIDQIQFQVGADAQPHFNARASLLGLPHAITPGVYEHAERYPGSPGHPGFDVSGRSRGCNQIAARFQVHEYTADPIYGTVHSATISFEQVCEPDPSGSNTQLLVGCFHFEQPPPETVTPPTPDPTKVSVQVNTLAGDGKPDLNARALFMDGTGAVVLDTAVNAFGQAEAALPSGGSITTIQRRTDFNYVLQTRRGLVTGDHVVVNPPSGPRGANDQMLLTWVAPASDENVAMITACESGSRLANGMTALDFFDGCRTPTFGVLGIAIMPSPQPRQFLWNDGIPHVAYTNAALSGTWAPFETAMVTLVNVPASSPAIRTQWATLVGTRRYVTGDLRLERPVASTQSVALEHTPGAGNGTVVTLDIADSLFSPRWFENRTVVDTGHPSAVTVDFAAQRAPSLVSLQQTRTGASWTQTTGTADVRSISWSGTTQSANVSWLVYEPANGQTTLTLPTLPFAYAALDPAADPNTRLRGMAVRYIDYDTVTGFPLEAPDGSYRSHTTSLSLPDGITSLSLPGSSPPL
jgi:hypothetical protein